MKIFYLPDLGEGLAEAVIREWHVSSGDKVLEDQVLVTVETAKSLVDLPAPETGVINKLCADVDKAILTNAALLEYTPLVNTEKHLQPSSNKDINSNEINNKQVKKIVKAIPAARSLAKKLGVDLEAIHASGPNETITIQDVELATKKANIQTTYLSKKINSHTLHMQKNLLKANNEVVDTSIFEEVDVNSWFNIADTSVRIIKSLIFACKLHPKFNAHYITNSQVINYISDINLGIAIHTEHGTYLPVIKHSETLSEAKLRNKLDLLKKQCINNQFSLSETTHPSVILSNIGMFAGKFATPILLPPCTLIVAIGKIRDQVVAFKNEVKIHPVLPISITFDHRVITGGEAALFLATFTKSLGNKHASINDS